MTDTMRERIARGQAEFDGRGWLNMPRGERDRYLDRADAAIEAMRKPTVPMCKAMILELMNEDSPHRGGVWGAMIDAAISEGKE
jgi:hypothetical protein